jgi:hypothetical protein
MLQDRLNVSTVSSPHLPSASDEVKQTIARAQLVEKHPFLGLDRAAQGLSLHDVYETCASINFDELPRPIEGAIPHHFCADLIESASICQLCRVVLYAVGWQRDEIVRNVRDGAKPYLWASRYITGPVLKIESAARAPEGSKTSFHGSKASIDIPSLAEMTGRQIENVFWDAEPVLPCWTLVIDTACALLVVPSSTKDEPSETWERVGLSDAKNGFKTFWEVADQAGQ